MITDTDIYYFPGRVPGITQMAMGFGINGKIICDLATYKWFFDLLVSLDSIEPVNEDASEVNFIKEGVVIETLKTSSFLGSLLSSNPDFLEIFVYPNQAQYNKNHETNSGFLYEFDNIGNPVFIKPDWWNNQVPDENGLYPGDKELRSLTFYTGE